MGLKTSMVPSALKVFLITVALVVCVCGCMSERQQGDIDMELPEKFSGDGTGVLPEK